MEHEVVEKFDLEDGGSEHCRPQAPHHRFHFGQFGHSWFIL
jgi:hypothetical protein